MLVSVSRRLPNLLHQQRLYPAADAAITSDKQALLPGQTATFANYSSFFGGINGIMVDVQGLAGTPTATDFVLRVGNDSNPDAWAAALALAAVTVRPSAGVGGWARIELTCVVWLAGCSESLKSVIELGVLQR